MKIILNPHIPNTTTYWHDIVSVDGAFGCDHSEQPDNRKRISKRIQEKKIKLKIGDWKKLFSELITRSATSKEENNVNGGTSTFSRSSSLWRLQMQLQHFPSPRILLFFLLSQYNNQLKLMTIETTDWFDLIYAAIVDWSKLFDEIDQVLI